MKFLFWKIHDVDAPALIVMATAVSVFLFGVTLTSHPWTAFAVLYAGAMIALAIAIPQKRTAAAWFVVAIIGIIGGLFMTIVMIFLQSLLTGTFLIWPATVPVAKVVGLVAATSAGAGALLLLGVYLTSTAWKALMKDHWHFTVLL